MNALTRAQIILFLISSDKIVRYNSVVSGVHNATHMLRPEVSTFKLQAAFYGYPGRSSNDSALIL